MRPIGFSTGAVALADFQAALQWLKDAGVRAVELSALRMSELEPLAGRVPQLDLSAFDYVSFHAPSRFSPEEEPRVIEVARRFSERGWAVVLHPDAIHCHAAWHDLGPALLIENMDKRKPCGRSASELARVFDRLPYARMCFDIAHARQFDGTMTEAYRIAKTFGDRIAEIHVSEVTSRSGHDRVSLFAAKAFRSIAPLLPDVAIIIESRVSRDQIAAEIDRVREALSPADTLATTI